MSFHSIRELLAGVLTARVPLRRFLLPPSVDVQTLASQQKWYSARGVMSFSWFALLATCLAGNASAACGMQSVIFRQRSNSWWCWPTPDAGPFTEAVDVYLDPRRYLELATDQSVPSIEDQILVAVRVAAINMEALYGDALSANRSAALRCWKWWSSLNAAWSAYCLQKEFHAEFPNLGVVYGGYDLITRHVRMPLSPPASSQTKRKVCSSHLRMQRGFACSRAASAAVSSSRVFSVESLVSCDLRCLSLADRF